MPSRFIARALPPLLAAAAVAACFGPHVATGSTPRTPGGTFACMTTALHDLGFTITRSDSATGFLKAERRDAGSPGGAEYTQLTISIYTDRDNATQFMISAARGGEDAKGEATSGTIETQDVDAKAADDVSARCGHR